MPAKTQSYANHAYLPRPSIVASFFNLLGLILVAGSWAFGWPLLYPGVVSLGLSLAVLVAISRWYVTALQNRIIRLEMRWRLRETLPRERQADIERLSTRQLVGLRFASDEELPGLVDRSVRENLTRDQIKRAITNWQADWERT
jgi:Family of unknown function (DUF6526)